ncbi:hypothetical protein [Trinickia sp. Y13]|uniref:hypothetical protein n=1 Tax=Trinickia sp. Y13 TaxID=2917807 RepID=UPI0024049869|nr:hypothetical protein [Trinickia sp. Y13]MDG0024969.1 hypothetical protein [Trinickia sp. Y13]
MGHRYTLHPGQFYPLRLHYRGEVMAALRHGAVLPIAAQQLEGDDLPTFDFYLRAELDPL